MGAAITPGAKIYLRRTEKRNPKTQRESPLSRADKYRVGENQVKLETKS